MNRPYFRNLYSDLEFDYPKTGRKNMKFDPAPPTFNWINKNEVPIDEVDEFLEEYKERFFLRHMQQYFAMVKCIDFNVVCSFLYLHIWSKQYLQLAQTN